MIKLIDILKEFEDESSMKSVKLSKGKKHVYISGFNDKLNIDRVSKFLDKMKIKTIESNGSLKVLQHSHQSQASLLNNLKTALINGFGKLADSIVVKEQ